MLKKFLIGTFVVALMFVGAVALTTKTASAAPQAIVTVSDIQYAATVRQGSSGQAALIWQRFLNGYSITAQLVEDGAFGPLSAAQARAWQSSKGLVADSVLGPMSRAVAMAQIQSGSPASAFPAGCTSTVGYSSVTGFPCSTITTLPAGCTTTAGFSPSTGALCSGSVSTLPAGCSTTAGFSPTTGASCSGAGSAVFTGPLTGGAGDATLTHYATSEKSLIKEGESGVKVLGFRVEATDSDIALQNIKVTILNTNAPAGSSYRLDRYLDSVDIYMGSTKVGSANVADFTKDSSGYTYSKSIALSNAVVRNGDKDPFYVVFNAASTIDTTNADSASLTVTVDSYRFQDATGVIMSYDATGVTNVVTIDQADDALTLSSSLNNPDSSTLTVLESDTTPDVLALAFKLKAGTNSSDISLGTLPIKVTISGAGSTVTTSQRIIDSVVVKIGSSTITADEPTSTAITAGAGNVTYTADFTNEGIVLSAGEIIEAKVYITFQEQSGNYAEATVVTASIAGNTITAASNNNDSITASSSQTGAALTLSLSANTLSNVSWAVGSGPTAGYIEFLFTVAASNGDYNLLLANLITNDTVTGNATTVAPVLTQVSGDPATVISGGFTIPDGSTTNFSLLYSVTGTAGQFAQVKITSVAGQEVPVLKQVSTRLQLN